MLQAHCIMQYPILVRSAWCRHDAMSVSCADLGGLMGTRLIRASQEWFGSRFDTVTTVLENITRTTRSCK